MIDAFRSGGIFFVFAVASVTGCSGDGATSIPGSADGAAKSVRADPGTTPTATGTHVGHGTPDGGVAPTADAGLAKPPGPPPPRADLNALSAADRQKIHDAITQWIRTAKIPVKVAQGKVVSWHDSGGTLTPVSVVHAHHSIHHAGEAFFACHRWYVQTLESALASALPNGRLPKWNPDNAIPAPFDTLAPPSGGDCETLGSLTSKDDNGKACQFAWTNRYVNVDGDYVDVEGLEDATPNLPIPSKYLPGNVCSFSSLDDLADDIGTGIAKSSGYHNDVHNTIGGTMQTMDAPAAAIFWPWHATVDDIFQNWLDCKKGPPPPPCF